jgi:hypothetical protein
MPVDTIRDSNIKETRDKTRKKLVPILQILEPLRFDLNNAKKFVDLYD